MEEVDDTRLCSVQFYRILKIYCKAKKHYHVVISYWRDILVHVILHLYQGDSIVFGLFMFFF